MTSLSRTICSDGTRSVPRSIGCDPGDIDPERLRTIILGETQGATAALLRRATSRSTRA